MAVVDSETRVRGIEALRLVDSSIFPTIPNGNLNSPTIMVAERAADIIKGKGMLRRPTHPSALARTGRPCSVRLLAETVFVKFGDRPQFSFCFRSSAIGLAKIGVCPLRSALRLTDDRQQYAGSDG